MRTVDDEREEEYQKQSFEEELKQEEYRKYYAEMEYRGELTKDIPLDELETLCTAYKDKRVVVLPCKVGDKAYIIANDCVDNTNHESMCYCWGKSCDECNKAYERVWEITYATQDIHCIVNHIEDFGKTVFLTKEQAEAALVGMEGKDNV